MLVVCILFPFHFVLHVKSVISQPHYISLSTCELSLLGLVIVLVIVFHISSHRKHRSANKPPRYTCTPIHAHSTSLPPPPSPSDTGDCGHQTDIPQVSPRSSLQHQTEGDCHSEGITTTHVTFKMAAKCTTLPLISQVWLSKLCPTMTFISHYSTQEVKHSNVVQLYDYHVSYTLVM